jgi:hypothetical protein
MMPLDAADSLGNFEETVRYLTSKAEEHDYERIAAVASEYPMDIAVRTVAPFRWLTGVIGMVDPEQSRQKETKSYGEVVNVKPLMNVFPFIRNMLDNAIQDPAIGETIPTVKQNVIRNVAGITVKTENELTKLLDKHGIVYQEVYKNQGVPEYDLAIKKRMHQYLDLYGKNIAGDTWNPIVSVGGKNEYFRNLEPIQQRVFLKALITQARQQAAFDVRKSFVKSHRGYEILYEVDKRKTPHITKVGAAREVDVESVQKSAKAQAKSLGMGVRPKSGKVPNIYQHESAKAVDDDDGD